MKKWIVKGILEEINIVLGCIIDTMQFIRKLPLEKFKTYSLHVNDILRAGKIDNDNL